MKSYQVLAAAEVEQFISDGYVIVRQAFSRAQAQPILERLWTALAMDPKDPTTWTKPRVHLQQGFQGPDVDACYTPRFNDAMADLLGAGRFTPVRGFGWWPVTFPGHAALPWRPPTEGWHVDGQQFHHHVWSPDQGLLLIPLFSDIEAGGGGTAILPGSHLHVARMLAASEPAGMDCQGLGREIQPYVQAHLREAIETTGQVGDVAILHPFMMHAASMNCRALPRIICNPCQGLHQPMDFHRADPADLSPVEQAIIRGAGDLLAHLPAASR